MRKPKTGGEARCRHPPYTPPPPKTQAWMHGSTSRSSSTTAVAAAPEPSSLATSAALAASPGARRPAHAPATTALFSARWTSTSGVTGIRGSVQLPCPRKASPMQPPVCMTPASDTAPNEASMVSASALQTMTFFAISASALQTMVSASACTGGLHDGSGHVVRK